MVQGGVKWVSVCFARWSSSGHDGGGGLRAVRIKAWLHVRLEMADMVFTSVKKTSVFHTIQE